MRNGKRVHKQIFDANLTFDWMRRIIVAYDKIDNIFNEIQSQLVRSAECKVGQFSGHRKFILHYYRSAIQPTTSLRVIA